MKNFVFSAVAFVAFAGAAFASNEVKEIKVNLSTEKVSSECTDEEGPDYPCVFTLLIKNKDGKLIKSTDYKGTSYDEKDCCEWADSVVRQKQKEVLSQYVVSHNL